MRTAATGETFDGPRPAVAPVKYPDQTSKDYKEALVEALRAQWDDRYSHLNDTQFDALKELVTDYSDVIVIDGVAPSIVRDYLFDIELVPGAQPSRAQLPKMSPAEMKKEQYHIEKEEALGHLRVPTDEQKSDWSCRTHIVFKKDDPMGR